MKTKTDRKKLQEKLIKNFTTSVKLVTETHSKKISKSIKRASKIVAKAITKEMDWNESSNTFVKKPSSSKKKDKNPI